MKTTYLFLAFSLLTLPASAKLNVVATITDFGAIAQEIGHDKVKVTSIARGPKIRICGRPAQLREGAQSSGLAY